MGKLPKFFDPDLLVGTDTSDDAAVYKVSEELALIQTVDFFTPIADDPYTFGQIAAANALSDVYAMGGEPKIALNIAAFPGCLSVDILGRFLQEAQIRFWRREQSLPEDTAYKTMSRNTVYV